MIGLPEIAFPIGYQPHAASGREVPIGAIVGGPGPAIVGRGGQSS
jgi:hypothetical protein